VEIIVLCGIQGSGKTRFARESWYESHVRINLDMLRTRAREDIVLHACLAAKAPIVIDNTNLTRAQRARYLRLARAAGFGSAALYYFETAVEEALRRNATRPEHQRVSPVAIRGAAKKLEVPSVTEGWDRLVLVRAGEGGGFDTQEISG
jgi:predicted kinase